MSSTKKDTTSSKKMSFSSTSFNYDDGLFDNEESRVLKEIDCVKLETTQEALCDYVVSLADDVKADVATEDDRIEITVDHGCRIRPQLSTIEEEDESDVHLEIIWEGLSRSHKLIKVNEDQDGRP